MIKVGYMGIPFSNSAEMSERLAEAVGLKECEHVALMSAEGVVSALMEGSVDYGVLAVCNRFAGPVIETRDALEGKPLESIYMGWTHIHHCVFLKNSDAKITKLVSHIQALLQSKDNLRRLYPDAEFVECEDTAYAAEMLADGTLSDDCAAVCRRDAGEHYGLFLAHENVEDNTENMTQFSIIRRV